MYNYKKRDNRNRSGTVHLGFPKYPARWSGKRVWSEHPIRGVKGEKKSRFIEGGTNPQQSSVET